MKRNHRTFAGWSAALLSLAAPTLFCAWAVQAQQAATPVLVLPVTSGGATDSLLRVRLDSGAVDLVERLRRDALAPRRRRMAENLFQVIGRPAPAVPGEVFFVPLHNNDGTVRDGLYVESPIGYMAYFEDLGKGGKLGTVKTVVGRPFEAVASTDANFALLLRHDSTGRVMGAYLYHGTSGRGVYVEGLNKLELSLKPKPTPQLPALAGRIAAVELLSGSEATRGYLVADPATGSLHVLEVPESAPERLKALELPVNLYNALARQGAVGSPRRFELVAIRENKEFVRHALILDAVTGDVALLAELGDPITALLLKTRLNIDAILGRGTGERVLTAVPNQSSGGQTVGVWVFDSRTGSVVYLSNPGNASAISVARAVLVSD